MKSDGQNLALQQLKEIESSNNYVFEITNVITPDDESSFLKIDTSIFCGDFNKAKGGLPLRERERFRFSIKKDFPLSPPSINVLHDRFAGWPHVQWKNHLCLYQSTQSEWNPSDGMFGYMDRLRDWLAHGALNELDPTGQPLHPPAVYREDFSTSNLVPRANTPVITDTPWLGMAKLERINKYTLAIVDWKEKLVETPDGKYAAAILLPRPFPFEYPTTVVGLLVELRINFDLFSSILQSTLLWKNDDDPFMFIVGTPMRGIKGSENLKQHLCAWEFEANETAVLKISLNKYSKDQKRKALGEAAEQVFKDLIRDIKIRWCRIFEDREEIVTRRDHSSNLSAFFGKTVSIWGCGALGANIALHLARAGVKKLILRDNDIVTPGILVRQPFREYDIGITKIEALRYRISTITKSVEVEKKYGDIKAWLSENPDWSEGSDLIIDCTASNLVHTAFELYRLNDKQIQVPVVSMVVDSVCQKGCLVQLSNEFTGRILDGYRKGLLLACEDLNLKSFADAFYPDPNQPKLQIFQPEPGCSDPTFVGSSSDSAALASLMLEFAANALSPDQKDASVWFVSKNINEDISRLSRHIPHDYITIDKINGYEIRIAPAAWKEIQAEVRRNKRTNGSRIETGGLLFGQRDDVLKIVWIDSATDPPPDSELSENNFICGVEGTKKLSEYKTKQSRGLTKCIGTWHTHPRSAPFPSDIDFNGMAQILLSDDFPRKKSLLLIVRPGNSYHQVGSYLFDRKDFERRLFTITDPTFHTQLEQNKESQRNIGLSLSGGGSRAIAFHLGCLRALHDRNILDRVDVISSVSGGSVIAALYAYSNGSFSEFEQTVLNLLKSGIDTKIRNEFFRTGAFKKEMHQYLIQLPVSLRNRFFKKDEQIRRISYRTLCFIDVLKKYWFGNKFITDNRRNNVDTVINGSELRTGTAFRFGSKESGCWRFGTIENNAVSLAEAVALSAAYPLFLPSLDKNYNFSKYERVESKRVVISDGGVFDNTGVSCMEPGRNPKFSTNVYSPEYIICCNAGYGMLTGDFIPFALASRLNQVISSTMRKVQDATMKRLHQYKESGKIKGFILPYLGQADRSLPFNWPDLVKREDVNYPTDFSPMKDKDIDQLGRRGEQLTRLLIQIYCPEL
jgi:predicted acylesterase/phospholipase RssA/proteasome lid subunit RPN8/RPN11